ncbi:hypothetical protein OPQ81_006122 [Rhizoctonia solani]|nr:hypothetical protein OPQ81_006122 [Rhizoctonia solani]
MVQTATLRAFPPSKVVLKLSRNLKGKQQSFNFPPFQVSEVEEGTGETTLVTVKSLIPVLAEKYFRDELDQLSRVDGIYNSLQPETTKFLFKIALQFASLAAQTLPQRTAKLSFLIIVKTWELLDKHNRLDESIQDILHSLINIRDVVEVLGQASSAVLATILDQSKEPISDILSLLEDASVYIFNRLETNELAPISRDGAHPSAIFEVAEYLGRLKSLQETFHTSWAPVKELPETILSPDTNNAEDDESPVLTWEDFEATVNEPITKLTDPYEVLNLLRPTNPGGYDSDRGCMDGTREAVLNRIITWTQNHKNSERFMWISGQAGMGKTAVAASLCQRLDSIRRLAGSFFCPRNDPNFADPLRLIYNLVHEIASRCPAYAHEVSNAICASRTLCTAHLSIRYEGLVKGPLKRLKSLSAPAPLIVIVDALDECGDCDTRSKVLHMLYDMSRLVPWLKVIFTARPEGDLLKDFQKHCPHEPIVHLQTYDAFDDIRAYIHGHLGDLAREEQWPDTSIDQLCTMDEGVFLWAALATKYIKKSTIPPLSRLQQVIENRKSPVTEDFDTMYASALKVAMSDPNDDTKEAYYRCIGAVLVTSEHKPLAILDLQYPLVVDDQIGQGTLERIISSLGPLIFIADGQDVRFHHSSFKSYAINNIFHSDHRFSLETRESSIANCCIKVMQHDLRFNICGLESSHLLNSEVPNLKHRIYSCVKPALKYACIHWIDYFATSPNQGLVDTIVKFLEGPQLMYWIEVFSLIHCLYAALGILSKLTFLNLTRYSGWGLIAHWAKDAQKFLLSFYDPIAASTPHIYVSALAFAPVCSSTAERMRPYFPNTIRIARGADLSWHPCIKTILHPHAIQSLSISPDGFKIIAGYPDGSLRMWDKQTGVPTGEPLTGHTDSVTCVVFSSSGKLVASSSLDATIRLWDLEGFNITSHALKGHSGPVNSISFSPDGAVICSGSSDKTIRLWDLKTMRLISGPYVGHSSRVSWVLFSPDGTKFVSGSWDKTIRVWSADLGNVKLADNSLLITGHSDSVTCVVISPDGSKIASGSVDKTIQIWDVYTGKKN